jgi:hypothetical protein
MRTHLFIWSSLVIAVVLMIGGGWAVVAGGGEDQKLATLAVPVLIAIVPIVIRGRPARIAGAVALWAWVVFATVSIAPAYGAIAIPTAILLTLAAVQRDPATTLHI